jgi:hypothetical protein
MELYSEGLASFFPEVKHFGEKIAPGHLKWEALNEADRDSIVKGLHRQIDWEHGEAQRAEENIRRAIRVAS